MHSSQDYPPSGQTAAQLRLEPGHHCQWSLYNISTEMSIQLETNLRARSRRLKFHNHGEGKYQKGWAGFSVLSRLSLMIFALGTQFQVYTHRGLTLF